MIGAAAVDLLIGTIVHTWSKLDLCWGCCTRKNITGDLMSFLQVNLKLLEATGVAFPVQLLEDCSDLAIAELASQVAWKWADAAEAVMNITLDTLKRQKERMTQS